MDLPDSSPQGFARHHPRIFREYPDSPARRSALSCLRVVGAPRVPAGATLLLGHGRGARLTALETEMPPGDFYTHVLEVLYIPARDAQHFMQQAREAQGADRRPAPEGSEG
jgi:hypothetical protein